MFFFFYDPHLGVSFPPPPPSTSTFHPLFFFSESKTLSAYTPKPYDQPPYKVIANTQFFSFLSIIISMIIISLAWSENHQ